MRERVVSHEHAEETEVRKGFCWHALDQHPSVRAPISSPRVARALHADRDSSQTVAASSTRLAGLPSSTCCPCEESRRAAHRKNARGCESEGSARTEKGLVTADTTRSMGHHTAIRHMVVLCSHCFGL